jgi:hypothetical protein
MNAPCVQALQCRPVVRHGQLELCLALHTVFQFTAYNTIAYDEIEPARMSAATSFYSTFQQFTLSLGICVAATALHVSTAVSRRQIPAFQDFSAAFWVVTGISLCSYFANVRFHPQAGRQMSGAH